MSSIASEPQNAQDDANGTSPLTSSGSPDPATLSTGQTTQVTQGRNGSGDMPWFVALAVLLWLAVLIAIVPLYHDIAAIHTSVPLQAGPVPLGIAWWGALGGVTVSLVGIGAHWKTWDDSYTWWHILRPIVGAIVGSVSYLIFITVIRSTGTTPTVTGVDSRVVFFLVAFITGYQEETFRSLISRATQVLMGPGVVSDGSSGDAGESGDANPAAVDTSVGS